MAAVISSTKIDIIFKDPNAAKAPAAKRRESPGRNGVKTSPVSMKIIINKIAYVANP